MSETENKEIINPEDQGLEEFNENPYDHQDKRPEDVVRLFYLHDVPIIPVVSKRGILIGILRKETVIAELSDIERVEKLKIDEFITNVSGRMNFDDLLQYGKIREFIVINIFGEVQGKWPRLQLFAACETGGDSVQIESEVKEQQEDEALESMIFSILEHIPRALYAVNEKGKTIFYNGHFEDLYTDKFQSDVEVDHVERLVSDPSVNDIFSNSGDSEIGFYNSELGIGYEKVPLMFGSKKTGYLIFFNKKGPGEGGMKIPGVDLRDKSLSDMIEAVERQLIVDSLQGSADIAECVDKLKVSKQSLNSKMKKYGIEL